MFGLGPDKVLVLVLVLVALFILGPERLPAAARQLGATIRKVKSFASRAEEKVRAEINPEWHELRRSIADLLIAEPRRLRSPHTAGLRWLLSVPADAGDPSMNPSKPTMLSPPRSRTEPGPAAVRPDPASPTARPALDEGERPPINAEAT